jgi:hypothetical protein
VASLPTVLEEWKKEVERTDGPTAAALDGSRESLALVAEWCKRRYDAGEPIASLVPGVAAYLAHAIQRAVPDATWVFWQGRDADQYRPVLSGFTAPFNVVQVATNALVRFLRRYPGQRAVGPLVHVYDSWTRSTPPTPRRASTPTRDFEVRALPPEDRYDFHLDLDGTFDAEGLVSDLEALDGVAEVVYEDRETMLVRAAPGANDLIERLAEVVHRHMHG